MKYEVVTTFGTHNWTYNEGQIVDLTAAEAEAFVKCGFLRKVKTRKRNAPKKDSSADA